MGGAEAWLGDAEARRIDADPRRGGGATGDLPQMRVRHTSYGSARAELHPSEISTRHAPHLSTGRLATATSLRRLSSHRRP